MTFDKKKHVEKLLAENTLITPELLDKLEQSDTVEIDNTTGVLKEKPNSKSNVIVRFSYSEKSTKREYQDFVDYFNARYQQLERIIRQHAGLDNLHSISHLSNNTTNEEVSIIAIINEKTFTKKKNVMITAEDPTGSIRVIFNQSKKDLFEEAKDLVYDEVVGIRGTHKKDIMFGSAIVHPDIPSSTDLKKSPYPGRIVCLSDLHVGSKLFLREEFDRFLKWIRGESGSEEQRAIAKQVRYVFIAGDLVDGVGIYPSQEKELAIQDIFDQYTECARLLAQIPSHIRILICPGNHDATRISEPQPAFSETFAKPLTVLPNVISLSNPSTVTIDATDDFSGLNILMYHGYSFDYYVATVDSIRQNGGYDRADLIMQYLLKRRHLAPAHTSTLYIPDPKRDPLFIQIPPDIFITGHVHRTAAAHYKNITLISGSCWQDTTPFQERLGHRPQPARVPVIDLQTRNVKILRFGKT